MLTSPLSVLAPGLRFETIRPMRLIWLLLAAALALPAQTNSSQKLNVLFIVSDDLNTDFSVYGHPLVKSPNLERLAKRGVVFEHAYCQAPVCNPSRSSFMTGLYPDQTGVFTNGGDFRKSAPDAVTMPQMFRQNGYYTARVGKIYHYGVPDQIGTDGEDHRASWVEVRDPIGRDKTDEYRITTLSPPPLRQFGGTLSWLADDGGDDEQTDAIGAKALIDLLERHKDEPFFIAMGFYRPHTPFVAPRKYFQMYPPSLVRLPNEPADDLLDIPAAAWVQRTYQDMMSELTQRQVIQAYYAAISFMDAQLGRVLDAVDRLGLADNTIIVFTSDHGYHMGEHHLWQKTTLFENSAHVPLIVAAPGYDATRGGRTSAVAELIDVYPTLADLTGLETPDDIQGVSLKQELQDVDSPGKSAALTTFITTDREHVGNIHHHPTEKSYSIRTKRWRYTEWGRQGWQGLELYDHDNDPKEFDNVAYDPRYADEVRLLKDLLATRVGVAEKR